jgi:hypothetical protein
LVSKRAFQTQPAPVRSGMDVVLKIGKARCDDEAGRAQVEKSS